MEKAALARARYGPLIDYCAVLRLLDDRDIVRFPTAVRFEAAPLQAGEFAWAAPAGGRPAEGFILYVHPKFQGREDVLPLLIAYHLASVNYGDLATHHEAELFGAGLLGLAVDDYYETLCALADS